MVLHGKIKASGIAFMHDVAWHVCSVQDAEPEVQDAEPEVRLLDFDSAGFEGSNVYPGFMNTDVPWPLGVSANRPVLQSHDTHLLANLINASKAERLFPR